MAIENTDQLMAEMSDHWYKEPSGNLYKLIDAFNLPMEEISNNASKVELWRLIDKAQGSTLDMLGKDVNAPRPTSDDNAYRFLIKLKYLLAHAQGTFPSIIKIVGTALGSNEGIKIWNSKTPRHVGIMLPLSKLRDKTVQKFLLDNLQKMLALGFWIDVLTFYEPLEASLHVGAVTLSMATVKMIAASKCKAGLEQGLAVGAVTFIHSRLMV